MDNKKVIAFTANRIGFLDAYSFARSQITKSQVAILMYHRVCPKQDNWSLNPLSPAVFEDQMQYYCRNYEVLSLEGLVHLLQKGKSLPDKAVVITLDDGYKDNYRHAYPILKKYNVPATIFLTTGYIGGGSLLWFDKARYIIQHSWIEELKLDTIGNYSLKSEAEKARAASLIVEKMKYMPEEKRIHLIEQLVAVCSVVLPSNLGKELILSWDEIIEISNDGISFGAHTVNHSILTNLPLAQAKWEITQSKKDIEERLGKQITTFAYPNGDYNSVLARFVKECGYTCAVSVWPGKLVGPKDNSYELSRIAALEDPSKMKVLTSGFWGDINRIVGRR